jgi:nucleotide-binding universal stress UspA family protein
MSYHKILVAIDRSDRANLVFTEALRLARHSAAKLLIFYCQPFEERLDLMGSVYSEEFLTHVQTLQEELEEEEQCDRTFLAEYVQQAKEQGLEAECELKRGDAGRWICSAAQSWQADLIAIGRRGHSGLTELFLGSVSNYVLHHAACSVLIVQGK